MSNNKRYCISIKKKAIFDQKIPLALKLGEQPKKTFCRKTCRLQACAEKECALYRKLPFHNHLLKVLLLDESGDLKLLKSLKEYQLELYGVNFWIELT